MWVLCYLSRRLAVFISCPVPAVFIFFLGMSGCCCRVFDDGAAFAFSFFSVIVGGVYFFVSFQACLFHLLRFRVWWPRGHSRIFGVYPVSHWVFYLLTKLVERTVHLICFVVPSVFGRINIPYLVFKKIECCIDCAVLSKCFVFFARYHLLYLCLLYFLLSRVL